MDQIRRIAFQRSPRLRDCAHFDAVRVTAPQEDACQACEDEGTETVHLRMCLVCGNVACCDSSTARHARRHHEQTGHPLIRSVEPGEHWVWCYLDRAYSSEVP